MSDNDYFAFEVEHTRDTFSFFHCLYTNISRIYLIGTNLQDVHFPVDVQELPGSITTPGSLQLAPAARPYDGSNGR